MKSYDRMRIASRGGETLRNEVCGLHPKTGEGVASCFVDIISNLRTSSGGELLAGLDKVLPLLGERAGVRASFCLQLNRSSPLEERVGKRRPFSRIRHQDSSSPPLQNSVLFPP